MESRWTPFHDLLTVAMQGFQSNPIQWDLVAWGSVIALLIVYGCVRFQLYDYRQYRGWFVKYPSLRFVLLCLGFLGVATILDLELVSHHYLVFIEEFLEMIAALALIFAYLSMREEFAMY